MSRPKNASRSDRQRSQSRARTPARRLADQRAGCRSRPAHRRIPERTLQGAARPARRDRRRTSPRPCCVPYARSRSERRAAGTPRTESAAASSRLHGVAGEQRLESGSDRRARRRRSPRTSADPARGRGDGPRTAARRRRPPWPAKRAARTGRPRGDYAWGNRKQRFRDKATNASQVEDSVISAPAPAPIVPPGGEIAIGRNS